MRLIPLVLQEVDECYFDQPRPELVEVARRHALHGRVLDVGCSRGWLGAQLLQQEIAAEVHGLEIDSEAVRIAQRRLSSVVQTNLEDPSFLDLVAGRFDAIVFADVLEHLTHPEHVLEHCLTRLEPGGVVLISLPNVRHHTVIRDLVFHNRWQYTDAGVLDRTHLRFFTMQSAWQLCASHGLVVDAAYAAVGPRARRAVRIAPRLLTFAAAQLVLVCSQSNTTGQGSVDKRSREF